MLKMSEINLSQLQSLKPEDTLLILDKNGTIKGMETMISYDSFSSKYEYIKKFNGKKQIYNGNLERFIHYGWTVFKVDERVFKYDDATLKSSWLDMENVFQNLYGDFLGSLIIESLNKRVNKDFQERVQFIDFCQKYSKDIHIVKWQEDQELKYTKKMVKESSKVLKSVLEKTLNKETYV